VSVGVSGESDTSSHRLALALTRTIRGLSSTEMTVLAEVAQGRTDIQIAKELNLTVGQVRYSIRSACANLGARNRPHAVAKAIALGYLSIR
jgi:DNA-binding CsgD family transcriptional regulator